MNTGKLLFLAFIAVFISMPACKKTPEAAFTADKVNIELGEEIKFSNTTKDGFSYLWDFGDGSSSTDASPVHTYSASGNYHVRLTAYSKKEKKSDEDYLDITVNDATVNDTRDKFIATYTGSEYWTMSGTTSAATLNRSIFTKSNSFPDRVLIDSFPYAIVNGANLTIPAQSNSDVNGNSQNISSGSGSLNGNDLQLQYSGTYQNATDTFNFSHLISATKQ